MTDTFKRLIAVVVFGVVTFIIGYACAYYAQKNKYERQQLEAVIEAQERVKDLESQLQARNAEIVDATIKLNNELNKKQKESVRYVEKITKVDNPVCPIRVGTLRMYNQSIGSELPTDGRTTGIDDSAKSELVQFSDFTGTVIDNNYEMQKDINRFKALQDIVRNYQNAVK